MHIHVHVVKTHLNRRRLLRFTVTIVGECMPYTYTTYYLPLVCLYLKEYHRSSRKTVSGSHLPRLPLSFNYAAQRKTSRGYQLASKRQPHGTAVDSTAVWIRRSRMVTWYIMIFRRVTTAISRGRSVRFSRRPLQYNDVWRVALDTMAGLA